MKLIVKNTFRDKDDHVTVYEPETVLEVKDQERADNLVKRGLCAVYNGKKAASKTLGVEAPAEKQEEAAAKVAVAQQHAAPGDAEGEPDAESAEAPAEVEAESEGAAGESDSGKAAKVKK